MISKSLTCAFAMSCMCLTYLIGGVAGGAFAGYDWQVSISSLLFAIVGKIILSLGWTSLFTFLNIIFRKYFGLSVMSSFFFGTGILIIGAAGVVEALSLPTSFLNIFLYGASVNACLSATPLTLLICLLVSLFWTLFYNLLGTKILNSSDVY